MMKVIMTNVYQPPLREEGITLFEQQTSISLPTSYRNFLLQYNGGHPQSNVFSFFEGKGKTEAMVEWFFGIHNEYYNNLTHYAGWIGTRVPVEFLPIGTDPGGNLICIGILGTYKSRIYFWIHDDWEYEGDEEPSYRSMFFVANTFDEFLDSLEELTLF